MTDEEAYNVATEKRNAVRTETGTTNDVETVSALLRTGRREEAENYAAAVSLIRATDARRGGRR